MLSSAGSYGCGSLPAVYISRYSICDPFLYTDDERLDRKSTPGTDTLDIRVPERNPRRAHRCISRRATADSACWRGTKRPVGSRSVAAASRSAFWIRVTSVVIM
jgi:hypothetical protein